MDFAALLTLIMSIISILSQIFAPKPQPTPTPTPVPAMMDTMTHINCGQPQWQETPSFGDVYVQGTMVKDCVVKMDAIALSSNDAIERMTGNLLGDVEQNPANSPSEEAYELSSSLKRDFNNSQTLEIQGQQIQTAGKVSLVSDHTQSVSAQYQSTSLPTHGDASYLKSLTSATQIKQGASDPTQFLVRVTTTTQILRPWNISASQFKPAAIQQLKNHVDQRAQDTITNLVNNLQ